MAEKGLSKWLVYSPAGYAPAVVRARFRRKGQDADIPIEYLRAETSPGGFMIVEHNQGRSTERELYLELVPESDLFQSNHHFYDTVWSMGTGEVTVTIVARPRDPAQRKREEFKSKVVVNIKPPRGNVYWYDGADSNGVACPNPLRVIPDGKDELLLGVWCTLWLPQGPPPLIRRAPRLDPEKVAHPVQGPGPDANGQFGFDPAVVEFTHYTGPKLPPEIFGPAEDSLPWIVAAPPRNESREHSKWRSKANLAAPPYAGRYVLPIEDTIRTKAWVKGHVTHRGVNEANARSQPLAQAELPLTLGTSVAVRRVGDDIFPADGQEHSFELEFVDDDGQPVPIGNYQLEITAPEGEQTGTLRETDILVEAANGRGWIYWRVPELGYRPTRKYERELRVYRPADSGGPRKELKGSPIELLLNPSLKLEVDAEKRGLDWPKPHELAPGQPFLPPRLFEAGHTPKQLDLQIVTDYTHARTGDRIVVPVVDAAPLLHAIDLDGTRSPITLEQRTRRGLTRQVDDEVTGHFDVRLDNIHSRETESVKLNGRDHGPDGLLDVVSTDCIGRYYGVFDSPEGKTLFQAEGTGACLLSAQTEHLYLHHAWDMTELLGWQPEDDVGKVHHGTNLLNAALRGTIEVDKMHQKLFDEILSLLAKGFWDLIDIWLTFFKGAEMLFKLLFRIPGASRLLKSLVSAFPRLADVLDDIIRAIDGGDAQALNHAVNALLTRGQQAAEVALDWFRQAPARAGLVADKAWGTLLDQIKNLFTAAGGVADSLGSWSGLKDYLRRNVPGVRIEADEVLSYCKTQHGYFNFAVDTTAPMRYLTEVVSIDRERQEVQEQIRVEDEWNSFLNDTIWWVELALWTATLAAGAGAVLATLGTGGVGLPTAGIPITIGGAALAVSSGKVITNVIWHLSQAYRISVLRPKVSDKYVRLTKGLFA